MIKLTYLHEVLPNIMLDDVGEWDGDDLKSLMLFRHGGKILTKPCFIDSTPEVWLSDMWDLFLKSRLDNVLRLQASLMEQYKATQNYDRTTEIVDDSETVRDGKTTNNEVVTDTTSMTDTKTGTDTTTASNTTGTTYGRTNTTTTSTKTLDPEAELVSGQQVVSADTGSDSVTDSGTSGVTYNTVDTIQKGGNVATSGTVDMDSTDTLHATHVDHTFGNIGVTYPQDGIIKEVQIRMHDYMCDFVDAFAVLVSTW